MDRLEQWFLNPSGLTPHGYCLLWQPGLIWLHAISDACIGLAYFSIPLALSVIIRRRPDLVFRPMAILFVLFILACGTGHWLSMLTLWVPAYGTEGVVKGLTAVISMITAVSLWALLPQVTALPSPLQMRQAQADMAALQRAESRLAIVAAETAQVRDALAAELAQRETMETALRESEGRFRLLVQSNLAEALYLMDPLGNIETWNIGAERIKGYRADEVIGQHFSLFFTPHDRASGAPERALSIARETGHFASEGWRVRKDGTNFLARVAIDAIRNDDGSLRGFVKVTVDLTKERIDEALRRIIVEAAPNGLMTVDEKGIVILANSAAERMFGYHNGALVGQKADLVLPGFTQLPTAEATSAPSLHEPRTIESEVIGRNFSGTPLAIELRVSPVRTRHGNIAVLSLVDITERQRKEAERQENERRERAAIEQVNANLDRLARHLAQDRDAAERANRAKTHFLAGMSHELRTPLNAILGYSHLLQMDGGLTQTQNARLSAILAASRHLLEMITCVLDLSEIESDHVTLHPSEIDAKATGEACLDLVRPTAEAKGLALRLTIAPDTRCKLAIDPTRFRQILVNLLGNAVKFTQAGEVELHLSNAASNNALRIEVRDTGPGIPAASRARLFQDFERLDAPSKVEGTGLGLALSARLTKLLGSTLHYTAREGGGSIFWMELAFSPQTPNQATQTTTDTDAAFASLGHLRVLVVDDMAINRDIAQSLLHAAGHAVQTAESGQLAIEAVAENDFDVVLMDVKMPEIDGLEATRRIRQLPSPRANIPIIGLTAYAYTEQVAECRAAGMDGHLAKPFEPETLFATVRHTVAAWRRRNQQQAPLVETDADHEEQEPAFNMAIFEGTCALLKAETTAMYLRKLEVMCSLLMNCLSARSDAALQDDDLAVSAHTLSGSVGMFGFTRLAHLCTEFERAVRQKSTTLPDIAKTLCQALADAQATLKSHTNSVA